MPFMTEPASGALLSTVEVARRLGITPREVYRLIDAGALEAVRTAHGVQVHPAALRAISPAIPSAARHVSDTLGPLGITAPRTLRGRLSVRWRRLGCVFGRHRSVTYIDRAELHSATPVEGAPGTATVAGRVTASRRVCSTCGKQMA